LHAAIWKPEMWRHHANDSEVSIAQFNRPTQHRRITAEKRLPAGVAQDNHGVTFWNAIFVYWNRLVCGKCPTERWLNAQRCKKVWWNSAPKDRLGEVLRFALQLCAVHPGEDLEGLLVFEQGFEHRRRDASEVRLAILFTKTACDVVTLGDLNQPVSNRPGDRIEENRVHDAEDGRVGPDAEREREHGHGGEAGVFRELAEGEFQIVHDSLKR